MKEERLKILEMLSENKINAEDAAKLIKALGQSATAEKPSARLSEEAKIAQSIKEKVKLDEDALKRLGQTLSKSTYELGRKIGEEINKLIKDDELKDAGKKLGSSMKNLGLNIRDEVKESLEDLRRELAQEKGLDRQTQIDDSAKYDTRKSYQDAEAELDADFSQELEEVEEVEDKDEIVSEAMDDLRDAMDEVTDLIDDLKAELTDWHEAIDRIHSEEKEAFVKEMHSAMSEAAVAMANVSELCLSLENLVTTDYDIRYAQELINWAKKNNDEADTYLAYLQKEMQTIEAELEQDGDLDSIF